jgi:hypothetical protein
MNSCESCGKHLGRTQALCDDCVTAAPASSASVVLVWFLRVLALAALVALYGGLILTIGLVPFGLLLLVAGAGLEFLIRKQ